MAFSLCACAGYSDISGTTVTSTPTPESEDEQELELCGVNGGAYENAHFGFGCSLDAEWSYADEDTLLDEENISDTSVKQLPDQLAAASTDVQSCEGSTIEFAGAQHSCVYIHSLISGIDFYQLQIYVKNGNYISFVTLFSPLEENLDAMLTFFYAV